MPSKSTVVYRSDPETTDEDAGPSTSSRGRRSAASAKGKGAAKAAPSKVPAFLNKLYDMVSDAETNDLIHWAADGESFLVPDHERVSKELLPRYFKHSNFSSFVRQLNMYGFHKVPHLQAGALEPTTSTELWEFTEPNFRRGQQELLKFVQRKKAGLSAAAAAAAKAESPHSPEGETSTASHLVPVGKAASAAGPSSSSGASSSKRNQDLLALATPSQQLDARSILAGVNSIQTQQASISDELKSLQKSNQQLWEEAIASRDRHRRHQETTDRILRFLAGVFGAGVAGDMAGEGAKGTGVGTSAGASGSGSAGVGGADKGKGKGKAKAKGTKRQMAVVPRNRGRLMIGDGQVGLEGDDDGDDLEEIELPYADGEDEEMEEISSNRFSEFSPLNHTSPQNEEVGSTASTGSPAAPAEARISPRKSRSKTKKAAPPVSGIQSIESPEASFTSLTPYLPNGSQHPSQPPAPQPVDSHVPPSNSLALSLSDSSSPTDPVTGPLSPFSQWLNLDSTTHPSPSTQLSGPSPQSTHRLLNSLNSPANPFWSSSAFHNPHIAGLVSNEPHAFSASPSPVNEDYTVQEPTTPLGASAELVKAWKDADAIAADVDAAQASIDALVASLGLDPADASALLRGGGLEALSGLVSDAEGGQGEQQQPMQEWGDDERAFLEELASRTGGGPLDSVGMGLVDGLVKQEISPGKRKAEDEQDARSERRKSQRLT